jgi:hypothetical protein
MFDGENNPFIMPDDNQFCQHINSLESLRDFVLVQFSEFLAHAEGMPPEEISLEHQRQFLSMEETDNIVREHSAIKDPTAQIYAVGGESYAEYKKQMLILFRALATRVLSNIMCVGVQRGLLDHEFDVEANRFVFSITPEGQKIVDECDRTDAEHNSSAE